MNKIIEKPSANHYQWGNNCDSWILVDTPGLSVKQEKMPAGAKEKSHFHAKSQQFFFILKGTATFYCDDQKEIIREQQGIVVSPMAKHYIANETAAALDFLVISQPHINNDRIDIE